MRSKALALFCFLPKYSKGKFTAMENIEEGIEIQTQDIAVSEKIY